MTELDPTVEQAVSALQGGGVAILGTDTVYGLVARVGEAAAIARIYELKRRPQNMPLALLAHDVDALLAALPGIGLRTRRAVEAVLPGAYTLVVPAPDLPLAALGVSPTTGIGVRVPRLGARAHAVVSRTGPLASTSANLHGKPDAAQLGEIPPALTRFVDAIVDDGPLPGTPSTVVDVTGPEPRVLREGAVPAAVAIRDLRHLAP